MTVQHAQTLKTFDSYARESLWTITGKSALDGYPAYAVVLDMAYNPQAYFNRNLIYIRNIPFRKDFDDFDFLDSGEKARIIKEGTISLQFWFDSRTQKIIDQITSRTVYKADAAQQINAQAVTLANLIGYPPRSGQDGLSHVAFLPPITGSDSNGAPWQTIQSIIDAAIQTKKELHEPTTSTQPAPTQIAGYPLAVVANILSSTNSIRESWLKKDAVGVNTAVATFAQAAIDGNPSLYPSESKRKFEVIYNGLFRLTLPGAALYLIGFVTFLLASRTELKWLSRVAIIVTLTGWLVHITGIGIRWWLVQKSVGNWMDAIPIKNMFEAVLMSAFFGVTVGMALELWKRKNIFGAAASFVGACSLIAIFSTPYITGREIGGDIRQHAGILMSYWLYIHVTMVTASYALIGMTFLMGVWWMVGNITHTTNTTKMQLIDQCNLVMLQLAFLLLGVGIILGAMWADVSWGRPWGWDPKETFALVTWICYLIIIHVRYVSKNKAYWTATLSVVGFFIMLFNWIGVNFFLVGLHSYA